MAKLVCVRCLKLIFKFEAKVCIICNPGTGDALMCLPDNETTVYCPKCYGEHLKDHDGEDPEAQAIGET
jgi:hypothetical protein